MGTRPLLLILAAALAVPSVIPPAEGVQGQDETPALRTIRLQERQAILLHHEGTEHVLIPVSLSSVTGETEAFWLFPVPVSKESIEVDLVDSFPALGYDRISSKALHHRRSHFEIVYPCMLQCGLVANPVVGFFLFMAPALSSEPPTVMSRPGPEAEKRGLHAEVIAASSIDSLAAQLAEQGVELPTEDLAVFEPYCVEGFSLVLTSVSDPNAARRGLHASALYIRFPADVLYYPMRPWTSSRFGDPRPDIIVFGHVKPKADPSVLWGALWGLVGRRCLDPALLPEPMQTALSPATTPPYTRISWSFTRKEFFTSDLTFVPMGASAAGYELLLDRLYGSDGWAIVTFLVSFAVLLFVSGGLCGLIYLREWRRPACYGLLGVLSFPVVSYFTWRDVERRGIRRRRGLAVAYAFTYLVLFIALDMGLTLLLLAPLNH
ncbi:MAG: hypothetical protein JW889_06125 [Verrucomicrobia bacterium]|nr:hypothetical protein [Verrucomicrobiota bacterium]